MLGPDLLVAPIFNHVGEVDFYLPEGNWINYFSRNKVTGGKWIREIHGFDSLPLYIREKSKYLHE
jgi:alpha-D-xyloside xylohydrolase